MKHRNILALVVLGGVLTSCQCKILPPPTSVAGTVDVSAKLAAEALTASLGKGEISGNVKGTVTKTYATVSSDDIALYLLLQAANCESRRGNNAGAAELRQTAREELLIRRGKSKPTVSQVEATPTKLTQVEKQVLDPSPLVPKIQELLPTQ